MEAARDCCLESSNQQKLDLQGVTLVMGKRTKPDFI